MKTIHKYPLKVADTQKLQLPWKAQVLSVQFQAGELMMWALVTPDAPKVERTIHTYGTGHQVPVDPGTHIGTVQQGGLVWHLFID